MVECSVDGLVNRAERARGASLEEHILDVGAGAIDKSIGLVEAARLDFAGLFLTVEHLQLLVKYVDASARQHNTM